MVEDVIAKYRRELGGATRLYPYYRMAAALSEALPVYMRINTVTLHRWATGKNTPSLSRGKFHMIASTADDWRGAFALEMLAALDERPAVQPAPDGGDWTQGGEA